MSLSKSKCWYSSNCLYFQKCAVPLQKLNVLTSLQHVHNRTEAAPKRSSLLLKIIYKTSKHYNYLQRYIIKDVLTQ